MGRPPLPVGTWGNITTSRAPGGGWRARARFRDTDGVTRAVERTRATKGAARAALTEYLTQRTAPEADAITGESRLRDVADVWLAERSEQLAANTVRRYRSALDDHVNPALGSLRVREATVSRLDRFIKATTEQVGAPTAKLCASVLSGFLGLAVRHGAARTNPMRDVAGVTVESAEVRAMTFEEVTAARKAVSEYVSTTTRGRGRSTDLLAIIDVMLATGARIGEVLALRWSEVDLEEGTATFTGTVVGDKEKPGRMVRQSHTKGRKDRAYLLPRFGIEALLRQRVEMTHANAEDLVFPSRNGTLRDPGNVRRSLSRVLKDAGLGWVTPHTFRKTVATVVEREADLRTASAQMGHGSEDVTRRHYVERAAVGPDTRHIVAQLVPGSSNASSGPSRPTAQGGGGVAG